MTFYADLHVHSKYSRATSRDLDLEHMAIWAQHKGISVIGTGDFTHPAWMKEIEDKLVPAEPGLFKLRDDIQPDIQSEVLGPCQAPVRFMLEVEISTIYKKDDKTRKVHHLIYAPDIEQAKNLVEQLARIGNLASDGRPILGLDSRDLLEITLNSGDGCYLIPAHIWTPWFAALGSKSGFDSIEHCYGDLSEHIFAVETGLSSDPAMNWRLSMLDKYQLISNSDAHSPGKIGREACAFDTDMDYFAMREALRTGTDYAGTVEFFPEEGKYHMDGHRKCNLRLDPEQTKANNGRCPTCGKPITVGVLNRVDELADRPVGYTPDAPMDYKSLVPLPEIISEIRGVGEKSKKVQSAYHDMLNRVGSELFILNEAPIEDIRRTGNTLLAEAIDRLRDGRVIAQGGYDGEYGVIRMFTDSELKQGTTISMLFSMDEDEVPTPPEQQPAPKAKPVEKIDLPKSSPAQEAAHQAVDNDNSFLAGLDADQRSAASTTTGPLLIIAGPGTGKTRTLTHRIAHLVADHDVDPANCLAITFSRRAAAEMSERLTSLLPECGDRLSVLTFHALGLQILRDYVAEPKRETSASPWTQSKSKSQIMPGEDFRVASEADRAQILKDELDLSDRKAVRMLALISHVKCSESPLEPDSDVGQAFKVYERVMADRDWIDFDDLILLPIKLLESSDDRRQSYLDRWQWISVDEFQDIDPRQYQLVRLLTRDDSNICAIGDPDQSIYGFRGSDPKAFKRFAQDYPNTRIVQLTKNYRSTRTIVDAAMDAILPSTMVDNRELNAVSEIMEAIEHRTCASDKAEAESIVHTIEQLIGGSTFFSMDSGRVDNDDIESLSFSDFAVLYRTDAQSEAIIEALARSGMPYQKKSHRGLLDDPIAQAIMTHMSASDSDVPLADRLNQAVDYVRVEDPRAMIIGKELHQLADRPDTTFEQFQTDLVMGVDMDLWDPRADAISLLTLHASKGLEFPVVFLAGCDDGLLPLKWGSNDDAELNEERRLFFVGLTRAKRRLYLSSAKQRIVRGRMIKCQPTEFLVPINDDFIAKAKSKKPAKRKAMIENQMSLFG